ncbi:MAG: DUF493 family protein [Halobacteriovoraceae bacterium]|nr:DUF493 family protein [Halobacteriovoraceae bacterium]
MPSQEQSENYLRAKDLLDESYEWPVAYLFKFIVKKAQVEEFVQLFGEIEIQKRHSRNEKYVSLSITLEMHSAEEVLEVYEKVSVIEGIIKL